MHHSFCSFDNWLCDLIPTNWQLTLAVVSYLKFVVTGTIAATVPLKCNVALTRNISLSKTITQ